MTLQFRMPTMAQMLGLKVSTPHYLLAALHRPCVLYYSGETNRCVCCGKSNWDVGRVVAQCMFCDSAFDIVAVKRA